MNGFAVNDVHSQLNETQVSKVVTPGSVLELREALRDVRFVGGRAAVAGGRHAMGGQQFLRDGTLVDTRRMKQILGLDYGRGLVVVEAGALWSELVPKLRQLQGSRPDRWSIVQKQTGADHMSIGGALAANGHGRGLKMKPIVQDVESFVLVDANGVEIDCSRERNPELFALAIGGYGLFGVITSVTLRLQPAGTLERLVEVIDIDELPKAFDARIDEGFEYGDFQYMTDEQSDRYLRNGVFSCYRRVEDAAPVDETSRSTLSADDWGRLIYLAHVDKSAAFDAYSNFYLGTNGQVYDIDEFQMSLYVDDYHIALDRTVGADNAGSEMITELYVPVEKLTEFMAKASETLRREEANVIYGTIRLIEKDDETFLNWASDRFACIVFNLHVDHTDKGVDRAADAFRALIDDATSLGGSYFLTYHRYATAEQLRRAYPQFGRFLSNKRRFDPGRVFASDWYDHYRQAA